MEARTPVARPASERPEVRRPERRPVVEDPAPPEISEETDEGGSGSSPALPTRRLAVSRLALAVGGLIGIPLLVGTRGLSTIRGWLAQQSTYRLDFDSIELDPPPPSRIRIGAKGLLGEVRRAGGWPERISVLDLDLDALRRDFRIHCPWVEAVGSVRVEHPNRVVVTLAFRQPVARVKTEHQPERILDSHGVLLPLDEIEPTALPDLAVIQNKNDKPNQVLPPPTVDRPGHVWSVRSAPDAESQPCVPILGAARLAASLMRQRETDRGSDWLGAVEINPTNPGELWLRFSEGVHSPPCWLLWGATPGEEPPGSWDAARKWAALSAWVEAVRSFRIKPKAPYEYEFVATGIEPIATKRP